MRGKRNKEVPHRGLQEHEALQISIQTRIERVIWKAVLSCCNRDKTKILFKCHDEEAAQHVGLKCFGHGRCKLKESKVFLLIKARISSFRSLWLQCKSDKKVDSLTNFRQLNWLGKTDFCPSEYKRKLVFFLQPGSEITIEGWIYWHSERFMLVQW